MWIDELKETHLFSRFVFILGRVLCVRGSQRDNNTVKNNNNNNKSRIKVNTYSMQRHTKREESSRARLCIAQYTHAIGDSNSVFFLFFFFFFCFVVVFVCRLRLSTFYLLLCVCFIHCVENTLKCKSNK